MGFWVELLVKIIIMYLVNQIIRSMTPDAESSASYDLESIAKGLLTNTRSTKESLKLIYGKCRVGINTVYIGTSGTDNKYLHIIGAIGEGPITGFVQVDGVDQLFLDGELWTKWGSDYVTYQLYTGTSNQAVEPTLNAAIPEWTDPLHLSLGVYKTSNPLRQQKLF